MSTSSNFVRMLSRSLIVLALSASSLGFSVPSIADPKTDENLVDQRVRTVETYFGNFLEIADWRLFQEIQSQIISTNVLIHVSDDRGDNTYNGIKGYFASLDRRAQTVSTTDEDFRYEIVSASADTVVVRLRGTLLLSRPINGETTISDSDHNWTETFRFKTSDSKIQEIDVKLNIFAD